VPHEDDQPGIARTQREREDALAASPDARRFLFCDTTPLMTAVYSRVDWGRVPPELLEMEVAHDYAVTLVAGLDLPWVPDGLQRESEEVRRQVHECLLAVLRERGIPFTLLEGGLPQRMRQVEDLLGPP
jgi:nicotinamide riboside kinase